MNQAPSHACSNACRNGARWKTHHDGARASPTTVQAPMRRVPRWLSCAVDSSSTMANTVPRHASGVATGLRLVRGVGGARQSGAGVLGGARGGAPSGLGGARCARRLGGWGWGWGRGLEVWVVWWRRAGAAAAGGAAALAGCSGGVQGCCHCWGRVRGMPVALAPGPPRRAPDKNKGQRQQHGNHQLQRRLRAHAGAGGHRCEAPARARARARAAAGVTFRGRGARRAPRRCPAACAGLEDSGN